MTAALADQARLDLPSHWPAALGPRALAELDALTPFLAVDLSTVADRYAAFTAAIPGVSTFYAMKCNSAEDVLGTLAALGSSFEVASIGELRMLQEIGVDPSEVLYSNPIKPPAAIAEARRAGLWRFSFDSEGELHKLAQYAPGAAVYIRLRVDDSTSLFPLSRKFGAEAHEARALLLLARELGLRPYGVTFHVGSQCGTTSAWRQAIAAAGRLMAALAEDGVRLEMLDMGGGFPSRYVERVPSLEHIAETINPALQELLPYRPPLLAAEPGRHLVAESAVMVTSVLGREVRAGENWLYVDVGAYNGMMETQQTVQQWRFPLWSSRPDHALVPHLPFTVTGPSCDSSDTMFYGVNLPSTIDVGDRLYIGSAGAYTLSYASHFNGFAPPAPVFVGGPTGSQGVAAVTPVPLPHAVTAAGLHGRGTGAAGHSVAAHGHVLGSATAVAARGDALGSASAAAVHGDVLGSASAVAARGDVLGSGSAVAARGDVLGSGSAVAARGHVVDASAASAAVRAQAGEGSAESAAVPHARPGGAA